MKKACYLVLIAPVVMTACTSSPTTPGSLGDGTIAGIQIVGPSEVPPGGTVQFNLIATMSDRTTRDITNEASWTSANQRLASIDAPGRVTGHDRGTVWIEARVGGQQGRRDVHILPAGTYRLSGRLNERRYANVPLAGARVEVTSGAGSGLSATTDREGVFHLYGVAGDITLRATREGYSTATSSVTVAAHHSITIELAHIGNRPDVSGTYKLEIIAADECAIGGPRPTLPEQGTLLVFSATVSQDGPGIYVSLRTPPSVSNDVQSFAGRVEETRASFALRNLDDGQPISLPISASTVLAIEGTAVATISSATRLEGHASGEMTMFQTPQWTRVAQCSSESHRFVLTR